MVSQLVAVSCPLVSIVIRAGMLEYTELCVRSLLDHTPRPLQLVFLGVATMDHTLDYVDGLGTGLRGSPRPQDISVDVAQSSSYWGASLACREALEKCRGEYLVLLNSDVIVTRDWLAQLMSVMSLSPSIGLAGPMSNLGASSQIVKPVPYRLQSGDCGWTGGNHLGSRTKFDVEPVHAFAETFRTANIGKWKHVEELGGFCVLVRREVYKRLTQQGHLNTAMEELELFDSAILSRKAREFGYNLALCRDLFVHNFGTQQGDLVPDLM